MIRLRALLVSFGISLIVPLSIASAADYHVIHNFPAGQNDGILPYGDVLFVHGDLYGTTANGGGRANSGTLFKIADDGTEAILHAFTGKADGGGPSGITLERSTGYIYGITGGGGAVSDNCLSGCGVIYKVAPAGTFTVLHSFDYTDGDSPAGRLVHDPEGNFFGVTTGGGAENAGTIFKLASNGAFSVLHSFNGSTEGGGPFAGLVRDAEGNLYGNALEGGDGYGVVFKLAPNGTYTVLHSFTSGNDGAYPFGGLARDRHGYLYGTTERGGSRDAGTIFKLAPDGAYTQLHSFVGYPDGQRPDGRLIEIKGALYGTTFFGGSPHGEGYGTLFKIQRNGTFSVLHAFDNTDGCSPYAGLTEGSHGLLYGATNACGTNNYGVVFSISKK